MTQVVEAAVGAKEPRPLKLDPKPRESLRGFIVRLAELELCTASQMRWWLGLTAARWRMMGNAARAAELCQIPVDEFERMGMESGGLAWVAGCQIPSDLIVNRMKVCPICLAADAYHRSIWELAAVEVCPIHKVKLIDRCPHDECGALQDWNRGSINTCSCGTKLTACRNHPISDGVASASLLYDRCGLGVENGTRLPNMFRDLPFEDLLELMAFLGRMDIVIARGNPLDLRSKKMSTDVRILDAGAAVMLQWPVAFFELAERVEQSRPQVNGYSRFGSLHRFVGRSRKRSFGKILGDTYRQFLEAKRGVRPEFLPEFLGVKNDKSAYVSGKEAMEILGFSATLMGKLGRTSLWQPIEAASQRRARQKFLPRAEVEALAARLVDAISLRQADILLGLKKSQRSANSLKLVEAGVIEAIPFNVHREDHELSVSQTDVVALAARIEQATAEVPPDDPLNFSQILFRAATRRAGGNPLATLFRLMLDGHLQGYVTRPEACGVERMVFERADAERAIGMISQVDRPKDVSIDGAARILDMRTPLVHGLIDAKVLPLISRLGRAYRLDFDAVSQFWDRYETAQRIARRNRTKSAIIEERLRAVGVNPVAVAKVDGRRDVPIYRKNDVDQLRLG